MNILIVAHPRSGTHLAINSLCTNFYGTEFPLIRNAYATLEGLFYGHDKAYTQEWENCVFKEDGKIKIFKSHLVPSEILLALNNDLFLEDKEKAILKEICENSKIIYVYRDGRDALVSMYYFYRDTPGGMSEGASFRFKECDFSEFIRMPSKYYMPIRGFEERDENRVKYWARHVNEWLDKNNAVHRSYESLNRDFESTMKDIASALNMEDRLADQIKKPSLVRSYNQDIFSQGLRMTKRVLNQFLFSNKYIDESKIPLASSPRKGVTGDWKNHFNESDLNFFLMYAKDTMGRLNYEI